MKTLIQITTKGTELTDTMRDRIEERAAKLDEFHNIVETFVTLVYYDRKGP